MNGDTVAIAGLVLQVLFSEPVNHTPSSITVDQGVTGLVDSAGPRTVTFAPDVGTLVPATTYTVTVATDITDFSGNHLVAPVVFSFTTM
jgi:hypothetical protein